MSDRTSRADAMRDEAWEEPDPLWIPPSFKKRMAENGNVVRWIRFTEGDEKVDRRLAQRFHQGWRFVKPGECPEWEFPPTVEHAKFSEMIAVGDVALAICPKEMADRLKRIAEKRAKDMHDAVKHNLTSQNSSGKMPVRDDSKQYVTTGGRQPKFGD
jgi:hypothetical protein